MIAAASTEEALDPKPVVDQRWGGLEATSLLAYRMVQDAVVGLDRQSQMAHQDRYRLSNTGEGDNCGEVIGKNPDQSHLFTPWVPVGPIMKTLRLTAKYFQRYE